MRKLRNSTKPTVASEQPKAVKQAKPKPGKLAKPGTPKAGKPATEATPEAKADRATVAAAGRHARNTEYLNDARYPFGRVSGADAAHFTCFANYAKQNGGGFDLDHFYANKIHAHGVPILNHRARAHRLVQAGVISRTGDTTFRFAPEITNPPKKRDGLSPELLSAIALYAKA
jgi:hypothetical protein